MTTETTGINNKDTDYSHIPTSPMRKERSSLVKKFLASKASKASQPDADQSKKSEMSSNKPKTIVKVVGLGRKRRGSTKKSPKDASIKNLEGDHKAGDEWEVVDDDDKSNDKSVQFDSDLDSRDDKPSETPGSSPLEKAASAADKSMLFIGENVHKVVLSTIKVLNKKD